jgi:hypothetical protein
VDIIERASLCPDGERLQSPKRRVINKRQKDYNVQNCNTYVNIPTSQTYRFLVTYSFFKFNGSIMEPSVGDYLSCLSNAA